MKTIITENFQWKREAKRRIKTIIKYSSKFSYYERTSLPNFEGVNRSFIYGRSDYFFIRVNKSPLYLDYVKYRYLSSSGKAFIIFQFTKVFELQKIHHVCSNCLKPYLKREQNCPVCLTISSPRKLRLPEEEVAPSTSKEIQHLKQIVKDLTSDENQRLLAKSQLKKLGFSLQEFYESYVYVPKGSKPIIEWSENKLLNKSMFQQTLSKLEKQNNLVKLFYNTPEWNVRKTDILERDKDKCRICGSPSNGVHHRVSASYNPEICLDPKNLTTVCKRCHNKIKEG